MIAKWLKKIKKKTLKANSEKKDNPYIEITIQIMADLSSETMQDKWQWNNIFGMLKEKKKTLLNQNSISDENLFQK